MMPLLHSCSSVQLCVLCCCFLGWVAQIQTEHARVLRDICLLPCWMCPKETVGNSWAFSIAAGEQKKSCLRVSSADSLSLTRLIVMDVCCHRSPTVVLSVHCFLIGFYSLFIPLNLSWSVFAAGVFVSLQLFPLCVFNLLDLPAWEPVEKKLVEVVGRMYFFQWSLAVLQNGERKWVFNRLFCVLCGYSQWSIRDV